MPNLNLEAKRINLSTSLIKHFACRPAQLFSNKSAAGCVWKDGGTRGMEGRELNVSTPQGNTQGFSLGK
jgi:hypothetical protein